MGPVAAFQGMAGIFCAAVIPHRLQFSRGPCHHPGDVSLIIVAAFHSSHLPVIQEKAGLLAVRKADHGHRVAFAVIPEGRGIDR